MGEEHEHGPEHLAYPEAFEGLLTRLLERRETAIANGELSTSEPLTMHIVIVNPETETVEMPFYFQEGSMASHARAVGGDASELGQFSDEELAIIEENAAVFEAFGIQVEVDVVTPEEYFTRDEPTDLVIAPIPGNRDGLGGVASFGGNPATIALNTNGWDITHSPERFGTLVVHECLHPIGLDHFGEPPSQEQPARDERGAAKFDSVTTSVNMPVFESVVEGIPGVGPYDVATFMYLHDYAESFVTDYYEGHPNVAALGIDNILLPMPFTAQHPGPTEHYAADATTILESDTTEDAGVDTLYGTEQDDNIGFGVSGFTHSTATHDEARHGTATNTTFFGDVEVIDAGAGDDVIVPGEVTTFVNGGAGFMDELALIAAPLAGLEVQNVEIVSISDVVLPDGEALGSMSDRFDRLETDGNDYVLYFDGLEEPVRIVDGALNEILITMDVDGEEVTLAQPTAVGSRDAGKGDMGIA